ncbi:MAG: 50S ribosomal protein L13 [Acidobacteria bacterium]|nr:50S ribosomal protein L13 [Acidobacteriota bacterium]MDW7984889.1 50S ribosomal protein L13 [Acidobacteriota bacterium]
MKTVVPKLKDIQRRWWVIDARGQVLGRVATRAAILLTGKHKPNYVPFMDVGDYVIVINAREVVLTGQKEKKKVYYRHSGYPGGLKSVTAAQVRATHPERLIEWAVSGMLPKNRLRKVYLRKLKVYADDRHPHQAQQPLPYPLV